MAKRHKVPWRDLAIILLIILVIVTNVYWFLVYRDLRRSADNNAEAAYNALVQAAALKACYDEGKKPCNTPAYQQFSVPKGY